MPHVMIVIEVHEAADAVLVPRLWWREVPGLMFVDIEVSCSSHQDESQEEEHEAQETHERFVAARGSIEVFVIVVLTFGVGVKPDKDFYEFSDGVIEQVEAEIDCEDEEDGSRESVHSRRVRSSHGNDEQSKVDHRKDEGVNKSFGVHAMLAPPEDMSTEDREHVPKASFNHPIVVGIRDEVDDEKQIKQREDRIENGLCSCSEYVKRQCFHYQSESKAIHEVIGIHGDIRMPELVDFGKTETHHDIHHGGVKLEGNVGGANVENHAEDALHDHPNSQGEKYAVLLRDSQLSHVVTVRAILLWKISGLQIDQQKEDDAIPDVAEVADDMVEVCEDSIRS